MDPQERKERMDLALEAQGLTRLDEWHEDDEVALCARLASNSESRWLIAEWEYVDEEEDDDWWYLNPHARTYDITELARIPPVAALLEACKMALDHPLGYVRDKLEAAIAAFEDRDARQD